MPRRLPRDDSELTKNTPARARSSFSPPLLEQRKPVEDGFYGAEAAAQQGYGWQNIYLFFANQKEADRFGVSEAENKRSGLRENFLDSVPDRSRN